MTALRTPWDADPAPEEAPLPGPTLAPKAKPRGRRPALRTARAMEHPAWLHHHLAITGPIGALEAFAAAARGSGVVPWQIDSTALEEDVFNLAAAQPPSQRRLSIEGCRILARQVRDRVEARQARAAALAGRNWACPFDLHVLLPVPDTVLQLGPNHPQAARGLAAGELGHGGHAAARGRAARRAAGPPAAAGSRRPGYAPRATRRAPRSRRSPRAGPRCASCCSRARTEAVDGGAAAPAAGQGGAGSSPLLDLAGFHGRLERLLALARACRIDLARIALPHLIDQMVAALRDAGGRTPLALQADWVVMAAWLLQLRSRRLLPAETVTRGAAAAEAAQLRRGLARLDAVQAAARWLDRQPRLGRDVFARGRPELMGIEAATLHQVDVIEFLWASLALLDDDLPGPDTAPRCRPAWLDLHAVPDARSRILRRMANHQTSRPLGQLLPDTPGLGAAPENALRGRSRWTRTFVASLELAKQGHVMQQQEEFSPIWVSPGSPGRKRPSDTQQAQGNPANSGMDETRAVA